MKTVSEKLHNGRKTALRIAAIALILLLTCTLSALAGTKTVAFNTNSRVYQYPDLSSRWLAVPSGMQVTLVATQGDWAMVENGGIRAFTYVGHLNDVTIHGVLTYDPSAQTPVVFTTNSRVYQSPSLSSRWLAIPKGMQVNLVSIRSDGWAMVENGGIFAYTNPAHLIESVWTAPVATPTPAPVPDVDYSGLMANAVEAVITANTRVYQLPNLSSASLPVPGGMRVKLLAISGDWAMVANGSCVAYMNAAQVSTVEWNPIATAAPTPVPTAVPTPVPTASIDYSGLMANAQPAQITTVTYVYHSPDVTSTKMLVIQGLKVNLLAVNGDWALVECNGSYAYMNAAHVAPLTAATPVPTAVPTVAPTTAPTSAPTATPEPEQPDYSHLLANAIAAVVNTDTVIYKHADVTSSSAALAAGSHVNLLAANEGWALIEMNGNYGFTNLAHISQRIEATPTPAPVDDYLNSSKYSNEQKCYLFLTQEMKLNTAAACGVMANIQKESTYNPSAGSSYYGLCQWGGGRLTNMKSFCEQYGYSSSSLEGQLRFMWYELANSYSGVLKALQSVENTALGAYEAASEFCLDYERPANKAQRAAERGVLARDTLFPRYS